MSLSDGRSAFKKRQRDNTPIRLTRRSSAVTSVSTRKLADRSPSVPNPQHKTVPSKRGRTSTAEARNVRVNANTESPTNAAEWNSWRAAQREYTIPLSTLAPAPTPQALQLHYCPIHTQTRTHKTSLSLSLLRTSSQCSRRTTRRLARFNAHTNALTRQRST